MDFFPYQSNTAKCAREYLYVCHGSGTCCSLLHISTGDTGNSRHWAFENTPSNFKTKHVHVVFVYSRDAVHLLFSTRKINSKNENFILGDIFFSSKYTLSHNRTVSAPPWTNISSRGVTSEICTLNVQREALIPPRPQLLYSKYSGQNNLEANLFFYPALMKKNITYLIQLGQKFPLS